MKKCFKCGAELTDDKKFCPYCGNQLDNLTANQGVDNGSHYIDAPSLVDTDETGKTLGICSIVFSFTFIIGLILGIIGLNKSTTKSNKRLNKIGISLSIGMLILSIFITVLSFIFIYVITEIIGTTTKEVVGQTVEALIRMF